MASKLREVEGAGGRGRPSTMASKLREVEGAGGAGGGQEARGRGALKGMGGMRGGSTGGAGQEARAGGAGGLRRPCRSGSTGGAGQEARGRGALKGAAPANGARGAGGAGRGEAHEPLGVSGQPTGPGALGGQGRGRPRRQRGRPASNADIPRRQRATGSREGRGASRAPFRNRLYAEASNRWGNFQAGGTRGAGGNEPTPRRVVAGPGTPEGASPRAEPSKGTRSGREQS